MVRFIIFLKETLGSCKLMVYEKFEKKLGNMKAVRGITVSTQNLFECKHYELYKSGTSKSENI